MHPALMQLQQQHGNGKLLMGSGNGSPTSAGPERMLMSSGVTSANGNASNNGNTNGNQTPTPSIVPGGGNNTNGGNSILTQAGLEEYSRAYYEQTTMYHHQKQSSYAQSEGYHSYVSSSDSSSTPFLDRRHAVVEPFRMFNINPTKALVQTRKTFAHEELSSRAAHHQEPWRRLDGGWISNARRYGSAG
uniref:Uncharacterized protein n=1 Tax=Anopheles culicifacies TaxID=139723 RepID=A0A182MV39_9DIPT